MVSTTWSNRALGWLWNYLVVNLRSRSNRAAIFFRLSLDPIIAHGEETGSIFIVAETTKQKLAEEALLISERLSPTAR